MAPVAPSPSFLTEQRRFSAGTTSYGSAVLFCCLSPRPLLLRQGKSSQSPSRADNDKLAACVRLVGHWRCARASGKAARPDDFSIVRVQRVKLVITRPNEQQSPRGHDRPLVANCA